MHQTTTGPREDFDNHGTFYKIFMRLIETAVKWYLLAIKVIQIMSLNKKIFLYRK